MLVSHTWQQQPPGLKASVTSLNHPAQLEYCNTSSLVFVLVVFTILDVWKAHNIFLSEVLDELKLQMLHDQLCLP